MARIILAFCFLLVLSFTASGQEIMDGMVTYNYTTEDGLSSNQVLFSMQDSKGYMWFGTGGGGATRFDGANFETFDMTKGILDNEVYQIFEDHTRRIWFGTYSLKFSYLENDSIIPYKYNHLFKENIKSRAAIKGIHMDKENTFFVFFHNYPTVTIDNEGNYSICSDKDLNFEIFLFENNVSHISQIRWPKRTDKLRKINIQTNDRRTGNIVKTERSILVKTDSIGSFPCTLPLVFNENFFIIFESQIILLTEDFDLISRDEIIVDEVVVDIINVSYINGMIWLLTRNKGIIRGEYLSGKFVIKDRMFQDDFITTMYQDSNEGLWLTSHYNGVFYVPHPNNSSIAKSAGWPSIKKSLFVVNDSTYIFAQNPTEFTSKNSAKEVIIKTHLSANAYIVDIYLDSKRNELFIISNNSLEIHPANSLSDPKIIDNLINNDKLVLPDNNIIFAGGQFMAKYISLQNLNRYPSNHKVPIHALGKKMDQLYFGTNRGLFPFVIENDSVIHDYSLVKTDNKIFNAFISNFENYNDGLWIAAKGVGVAFFRDSIEFTITEKDGLSSTDFKNLKQDGDTLWVSTSNGLNKLVFSDDLKLDYVKQINTNHGLSSNEIAGVETSNKRIFISTANGYDIINRKELLGKDDSLMLEIDNIQSIKNNSFYYNDNSLNYNENYLVINYSAVQYNTSGNHNFRYRLLPLNKNWKNTHENQVEFNHLAPEKYTFEIEIENNQGNWVGHDEIKFSINPPFWKTWWFIVTCTMGLLSIAYYIFKKRERKYREKLSVESEIRILKDRALKAQVNPHFIFNTLNAIQHFVLEGDVEKSNHFITKFATLIRMTLQNSKKDKISLQDEIELLEMYLNLEMMRYDNKFDYQISLEENVKPSRIYIPPMLIQPYVENAVWHGLANSTNKGLIMISFLKRNEETLRCTISDNGIGREASNKHKKQYSYQRKSVGMTLTNDRLRASGKRMSNYVTVLDLKDENGLAIGTEIQIEIPLKLNHDL